MRRLFPLIATLLLVLSVHAAVAQYQDYIWYFGDHAGMDFRNGPPVPLTDGQLYQWEGSAVAADRWTGQLLFYTDGITVLNRLHQPMPNGRGLKGQYSSTQSALILPMPGDSNRYYIFTAGVGDYVPDAIRGIHYSVVDMTLDGGLGDVIPSEKNIQLAASATEKLTAVRHCNGRAFWVITHEIYGDAFRLYLVNHSGVSAIPVETRIGAFHGTTDAGGIGYACVSPNSRRLAVAIFDLGLVEIFDIDRKNGTLSNRVSIHAADSAGLTYGVCFSPDGSKLYVTGDRDPYIAQFDISGNDSARIAATRVELYRSTEVGDYIGAVEIGPDGRIYVAHKSDHLGVITNPNARGLACGYVHEGFDLAGGNSMKGLPNFVVGLYDTTLETCKPPVAQFTLGDTLICAGECISYTDHSYDDPQDWQWRFDGGTPTTFSGSIPPTVCYQTPGDYIARLIASNDNGYDTVTRVVHVRPLPEFTLSPDTSICDGGTAQLRAVGSDDLFWNWSPARGLSCTDCANPVARPSVKTTYTVMATNRFGCVTSHQVTVTPGVSPNIDAGADVLICSGSDVPLTASGADTYQWTPATGLSCADCADPVASPSQTTTYHVVGSNASGCTSFAEVTVEVAERPKLEVDPVVKLCQGEEVALVASGGGSFHWSPAEGLSCTDCPTPVASPSSTTKYYLSVDGSPGCPDVDSVLVQVDPAPRTISASIDSTFRAVPGTPLLVPIRLDDDPRLAHVALFNIVVKCDPGMMRLRSVTPDSSLADVWNVLPTNVQPGSGVWEGIVYSIPRTILQDTGTVLWLDFESFIGSTVESPIDFQIVFPESECTTVVPTPGRAIVGGICGLDLRLVESSGVKYALGRNIPDPFEGHTDIPFSVGIDAPTTLTVYDASGRRVAVLVDQFLDAGRYTITWDASGVPSGRYFYRLISADYSETRSMVLTRR